MEIARRFGKSGYAVGLISRDITILKELKTELEGEKIVTEIAAADAGNQAQIKESIDALAKKLGGINTVVYNVPGPRSKGYVNSVLDIKENDLMIFLKLRIIGALETAQAAFPYLKESKGSLIFTSGVSDRVAYPGTALMGVAQAGLKLLVEHIRNEFKESGIYVGYTPFGTPPLYSNPDTEKTRTDVPQASKDMLQASNVKRVKASDIADGIFKMCSDREPDEVIFA